MKKSRYSDSCIIKILKAAEGGTLLQYFVENTG